MTDRHQQERQEDQYDRKQVSDLRSIDSSVIKWLGGTMTVILGFLAVMVVTDHSSISSINQWQVDHGTEIDQDHDTITSMYSILETHWKPVQPVSMADSTNLINQ